MEEFLIELDHVTAAFYRTLAHHTGLTAEQVLQDALFKLAGELSLEALAARSSFGC